MGSALRTKFLKSTAFGVKRGSDGHFRYPTPSSPLVRTSMYKCVMSSRFHISMNLTM